MIHITKYQNVESIDSVYNRLVLYTLKIVNGGTEFAISGQNVVFSGQILQFN